MNRPTAPAVPDALALTEAIRQSAPLADLRRRLKQSAFCLDAIRPGLPAALQPLVQAGPIDADGWTLLVSNAAAAAKLRQLRPRLEDALKQQGCATSTIRIKLAQPLAQTPGTTHHS